MGKIERVYDHSPIFLQNLMISVKGKLNEKERYDKVYYKELAFLREFDTWPLEKQLKVFQLR